MANTRISRVSSLAQDAGLPSTYAMAVSRPTQSVQVERRWTAWLCVLGSFLFLLPTYGFMQSVGVVQAHLQENQLNSYASRDIGWITGVYTFLALLLGIQAGPLMDVHGATYMAPFGAAAVTPMFFLLAECTEYWHFMLCLGVLGGFGGAIAATIAVSAMGKLFVEFKGLAMGLALTGASTGAVIWPLLLRSLLPRQGWKWSMRIVGFASVGVMTLGVVCFLPYNRLVNTSTGDNAVLDDEQDALDNEQDTLETTQQPRKKATISFVAFKSPAFSLITISLWLLEFTMYGVTGLLPTLAAKSDFPVEAGYLMIAILNGCSCLGRIIPGVVGDRIGHFNVFIIMIALTFVCTTVTLVPFGGRHIEALYVFSGLWGFGSGSFLSLTPICMGKTCDHKDYGRFFGTMNFAVSFSQLISVPIGGQMIESIGVTALGGLFVSLVSLGGVSAFACRSVLIGSWSRLRVKI